MPWCAQHGQKGVSVGGENRATPIGPHPRSTDWPLRRSARAMRGCEFRCFDPIQTPSRAKRWTRRLRPNGRGGNGGRRHERASAGHVVGRGGGMNGQRCAICLFWLGGPNTEFGDCRRYPMAVLGGVDEIRDRYPVTSEDDWCGEWKMNPDGDLRE